MKSIGNNIVHKFLLDTRTAELEAEHEQHNDIHFLNSHYSGRAVRFGEKLYLWLKYAHATYPNASYFGRVDDDTYACGGAAFDFVSGNLLNLWDNLFHTGVLKRIAGLGSLRHVSSL